MTILVIAISFSIGASSRSIVFTCMTTLNEYAQPEMANGSAPDASMGIEAFGAIMHGHIADVSSAILIMVRFRQAIAGCRTSGQRRLKVNPV